MFNERHHSATMGLKREQLKLKFRRDTTISPPFGIDERTVRRYVLNSCFHIH